MHIHSHTLVDDDENGRNKIQDQAPTSGNHGRPASEMIICPQVDSPSTPQNKLDEALQALNPNTRQSERLGTKPRRRCDTRFHVARVARAARQSPGSIELDLDPQSFQKAMHPHLPVSGQKLWKKDLRLLLKPELERGQLAAAIQKALGNKWVYKRKLNPDNTIRFKA